jgi:hypothetical protein
MGRQVVDSVPAETWLDKMFTSSSEYFATHTGNKQRKGPHAIEIRISRRSLMTGGKASLLCRLSVHPFVSQHDLLHAAEDKGGAMAEQVP